MIIRPVANFGQAPLSRYRYLRIKKTNVDADYHFHTELKIFAGATEVSMTGDMVSSSGFVVYANENLVDGSTATYWGNSATTDDTSYIDIDFGAGNEQFLDKVQLYIVPDAGVVNDAPIYDILVSNNGTVFDTVASGLDCSGAAGWKEISW
jgi:hypothetical protein